MPRRTELYDEFTRTRYAALLAYASLLTGARDTADALVGSVLKRTFSRGRRLGDATQVEREVRRAIAVAFLASAGAGAGAHEVKGEQSERKADAAAEREPAVGPKPEPDDPNPTSAGDAAHDNAPDGEEGFNPYAPPAPGTREDPEPDLPSASAPIPAPDQGHERDVPTRASAIPAHQQAAQALLTLKPQTRTIAVLRHFLTLTPGQIGEWLDLPAETVTNALQQVRVMANTQLHISLPEDSELHGADSVEITVADLSVRG